MKTIRTIERAGAWRASRRAGTSSRALVRELRALAAIVDSSDDAILAKTLEGTITSWNGAAEKLYGYTAREIIGENIATLVPPDRPEEVTDILERVGRGERIDHLETVRLSKDGTPIEMSLTISPIKNAAGAIVGASSIGRDIRQRKDVEAALAAAHEAEVEANRMKAEQVRLYRELADHDPLTGVLNRRSSSEAIERYLRLAERHGQPLSLAVLDIDHFKQVNDRHGHPLGDAVLRRLAELMIETFRGEDVVSRWGGEEFTIAMYGSGRDDCARRVGDLLEAFTDASISDADAEISGVTFTAGVAEYPTDGDDLQSLYRCADHALATGKTEGRGRVVPTAEGQSRGPTREPAPSA
jgi:diguanylate cyclase (GGDEF)-like protein/PAS domain S-box-containing protein